MRRSAKSWAACGSLAVVVLVEGSAAAQLPPLPPQPEAQPAQPPPSNYPPPQQPYQQQPYQQPYQQQPYQQPYGQQAPPPGYGAPYGQPPPPNYQPYPPPVQPQAPPPPTPEEASPTHAPKFSLWVGGRLGIQGFGGNFYVNGNGDGETTGNFVKTGGSLGIDVGARLGKRYVPYVFLEHGFVGAGHRFDGADASAATDLLGGGFRYIAGDVDSVGFLTDLSIGVRTVTVRNGGDTYKMSSLEILRLGIGAEIRISTLFVISPMATLGGGTMNDTSGHVSFSAAGSGDNIKSPTYQDGKQIGSQSGYVVLGLGCGGHFDFFGK